MRGAVSSARLDLDVCEVLGELLAQLRLLLHWLLGLRGSLRRHRQPGNIQSRIKDIAKRTKRAGRGRATG